MSLARRRFDLVKELIPLIQKHAATGEIYAAPECCEVYFLVGSARTDPPIRRRAKNARLSARQS